MLTPLHPINNRLVAVALTRGPNTDGPDRAGSDGHGAFVGSVLACGRRWKVIFPLMTAADKDIQQIAVPITYLLPFLLLMVLCIV